MKEDCDEDEEIPNREKQRLCCKQVCYPYSVVVFASEADIS
jgi:hypothetical protein